MVKIGIDISSRPIFLVKITLLVDLGALHLLSAYVPDFAEWSLPPPLSLLSRVGKSIGIWIREGRSYVENQIELGM